MNGDTPADAVIFVLLDACRHDYLDRTRFLRGLAPTSRVGRLEEPFGFCPRGAYFGGLTVAEQGFTNLMRYDPANSVFSWTRGLAGAVDEELVRTRLRSTIRRRAAEQLPAFAAAYADPLDVPPAWLGYFDFCEREAPWSRNVGYKSLFHLLEEAGRPWCEVSWPYAGLRGGADQRSVAGEALYRLREDQAFAYIHLPTLDALGHRVGPGAAELQYELAETDRLCELITQRALELYRDPVLVFAGDHGMVPVVRTVDVLQPLIATGLRFGHDFAFFIDSTMVRTWFFTAAARERAMAVLAASGAGHWVTAEEKSLWDLAGIDPRNGHEIFLASPGVCLSPSFFDRDTRRAPKGMHGYAPNLPDNQALLLVHRPRGPRVTGDIGTVAARRLFPSFLQWLGWDPAEHTTVCPIVDPEQAPVRRRWTRSASPEVETRLGRAVERCAEAIAERCPQARAVVLSGSFGRGEGAWSDPGVPANDLDFMVVGAEANDMAGLGTRLAEQLGTDFIDVTACSQLALPPAPDQALFDLRYGAVVLRGDPLVLDRLPLYAPGQIDPASIGFLVGNRIGGVLLALTGWCGTTADPLRTARHQLAKLLIAISDCWLMAMGDYHASYAMRRQRFADLAPTAGFTAELVRSIDTAYAFKLEGRGILPDETTNVAALSRRALAELGAVLGWTAWEEKLVEVVVAAVPSRSVPGPLWLAELGELGFRGEAASAEKVAAIYRACIAVLLDWKNGAAIRAVALRRALSPALAPDPRLSDPELPAALARAWLAIFH